MNLRTFFTLTAGALVGALSRPAKALSTSDGTAWIPIKLTTSAGERVVEVLCRPVVDHGKDKQKTI